MGWRPILAEAEGRLAREIAHEIAEYVSRAPVGRLPDPFRILLDGYLAQDSNSVRHADRALDALETIVSTSKPVGNGLYGGRAGIGWLTEHLTSELSPIEPDEPDPCAPLDALLLEVVKSEPPTCKYDLISGLAGIAAYAAERLPRESARELLGAIVDRLDVDAVQVAPGLSWRTPPEALAGQQLEDAPRGLHDLGVAHGVPGLTVVFARALQAGVRTDRARALLEGSVAWTLAQRYEPAGGAGFASYVPVGGTPRARSREAWCYGGLGVSVVLLLAARLAGRPDWETAALECARLEAARPNKSVSPESDNRDCGLCHGAAGNGHLYNRLYQATGEEVFREAALEWLRICLAQHRSGTETSGYLFATPGVAADGTVGPRPEADFLSGAAGVGLALLSAASPVEPLWDRLLCANIPVR